MLSVYELSCGGVEQNEHNGIRVSLWREHSVYHIRAHDFVAHSRLEWTSKRTLTDARKEYKRMIHDYVCTQAMRP